VLFIVETVLCLLGLAAGSVDPGI